MTEGMTSNEVEVWTGEPEDLDELLAELRGVPGMRVAARPSPVEPGEQGIGIDVLVVALSSGAVTTFLQIIKSLIDAKGPKYSLTIRRGRNRLKITADTYDAVEPAVLQLFGAQQKSQEGAVLKQP